MIADVAVPIVGIDDALSYAVPVAMEARVVAGVRALVPVGNRRFVGLVVDVRDEPVKCDLELKPLADVLDGAPVVDAAQLALIRFVAQYYCAELGLCARLVMPPDTADVVDRRYQLSERGEQARVFAAAHGLKRADVDMLELFAPGEIKRERTLAKTRPQRDRLARLVSAGLVEEASDARATGAVRHVEHLVALDGTDAQPLPSRTPALAAFDAWLRAFTKQEARAPTLLEAQAAHVNARGKTLKLHALNRLRIERTVIATPAATTSSAPLQQKALAANLTDAQQTAVARLEREIDAGGAGAFLLEGVTGSGKTEVYLRALRASLARGKGALLLVPEIGLTPQLVGRVQAALADMPGVVVMLHSGVSPAERRDALARLREGTARVAVGARSALFAPVRNLGLVVVDEEHDQSLKQDETPRYHARDVALWRARHEGAVCVLGSATPSLETRHNAELGKLEVLELPTRVGGGGTLPHVELVDLRARAGVAEARRRDRVNADEGPGVVLSAPLVEAIGQTLAEQGQVLLFLNKRGYASALLCESCGHIENCPNCSVALTLHRRRRALLCHQCDHEKQIPLTCPDCGADTLLQLGLGTERLESEVAARFPAARVARLDRDSVQKKGTLEDTLARIHNREVDIVVGTQMIAKGHDFPGVKLVGVVLADIALAMPDFRAAERAFALLAQVAGRAGRSGDTAGRVIVQTYQPQAPPIVHALVHDVRGFAQKELAERQAHNYPPFVRAALLRVESEDGLATARIAGRVADVVKAAGSTLPKGSWSVLGPAACAWERLHGRTRWQVFVRARGVPERSALVDAVRKAARTGDLARDLARAQARLILDLDPVRVL